MSILTNDAAPSTAHDDRAGVVALQDAFALQQAAFACDRNPSLGERRQRIEALVGMMAGNRERISTALSRDFGTHPVPASDLIEVLGVLARAQHVLAHLEEWMRPQQRETDPGFHGNASACIQLQPKGVVGNIVPWNFPFDLSVGPMIEMLAAGNRVIVKPSEYAPSCSALLAEMVAATFPRDLVHVATGGPDLAREFSALPWDHLLYTGSPEVGRLVMAAAARNLTPVTLELGGKCPAIMTPGSVTARNVESGDRHEAGQERADVRLRRLLPCATRGARGFRGACSGVHAGGGTRLRKRPGLHGDNFTAASGANKGVAAGGA